MNKFNLNELLACPKCKSKLTITSFQAKCSKCKSSFDSQSGIWNFLLKSSIKTARSNREYEDIHEHQYAPPLDGSYQILASIARGNKALDIASGVGFISKLSPQTVAVDFSLNALKQAQEFGTKNVVVADAHFLPFKDDSFDLTISSGSLEHFEKPQLAINEMARVSTIQVLIVHRLIPVPFAKPLFNLVTKLLAIKHQPIEQPMTESQVITMLEKAKLHVIFKGVWTLPVNYGRVIKPFPELTRIPSCLFFISIKKSKIDQNLSLVQ